MTEGFDILDKLENLEVNKNHRPIERVLVESISILNNPIAE